MDLISAPSNIALIKYMGKTDHVGNRPTNASLSLTLEHLRTYVTLEETDGADRWEALPGHQPIQLTETGLKKFLKHFARLKDHFGITGAHVVRSANGFPSDCGLASSASSFAALTLATARLAGCEDVGELSRLSRLGSGSSCRSFFSPWALWRGEGAEPFDLALELDHAVLVVEDRAKLVSSSQAHVRVTTSALFDGRPGRAERRLEDLSSALRTGEWARAFELCWAEFWDMHALFETSDPSFGYLTEGSLRALTRLREVWTQEKDGPLVTMDAGPNVHLLVRPDQRRRVADWTEGFSTLKSWS